MSDGVKLNSDKLQFLHAAFHFALVLISRGVRAQAGQAKKAAWVLCAQFRDLIVPLPEILCSRIRLHDRCVDSTLIHSPNHLFLGAV
jgi:hypothetical protein